MAHLLIVEDDALLLDGLSALFVRAGHSTECAADGEQGWSRLQQGRFDAVVLDLGLPKLDGLSLLTRLRECAPALPVLVLTARDGVEDRVAGLNAGADDYLTKPFNIDELLARLQAMLRRSQLPAHGGAAPAPAPLAAQGSGAALRLEAGLLRAWVGAEAVDLTQREWDLLKLLTDHQGQVVSREAVLTAWQAQEPDGGGLASNALEVYVHRLRRKLAGSALNIRNVRGLGYLLEHQAPP